MQLTHWRIGTCQNALLFEVSDEIRGCYRGVTNEEKEGALYYPSDHDCRKFCDRKLMKIRRLDWNLYLSMASSLHRTYYWLHSVLWVGPNFERLISFARTHPGALWGLCNDKPRGFFYHRNCYMAYTQSRSLSLRNANVGQCEKAFFQINLPVSIITSRQGREIMPLAVPSPSTLTRSICALSIRRKTKVYMQDRREEKTSHEMNLCSTKRTPW